MMLDDTTTIQSILARLTCLEEISRVKGEEIVSLQEHVSRLQNQVDENKNDNILLREKIDSLENEIIAMKGNNGQLELEKYPPCDEKCGKPAEDLARIQRRVCHQNTAETSPAFRESKDLVEENNNLNLQMKISDIDQFVLTQEMAVKIEAMISWIEKRNGSDVKIRKRLNKLKYKIKDLIEQTEEVETRFDCFRQSITCVRLLSSVEMTTGTSIKLGKCFSEDTNNGYFDPKSCWLKPLEDGFYTVNVWLLQSGDGELEYSVNSQTMDDRGNLSGDGVFYMGKTFADKDVCRNLFLFRLTTKNVVWLDAKRVKGDADVGHCIFMSWRIA